VSRRSTKTRHTLRQRNTKYCHWEIMFIVRNFPLTSAYRPALGPTQAHIQWVPGAFCPGVKLGRGVMLTTHPLLVPRLRKGKSYTSCHPNAPLWSVTGPLYLLVWAVYASLPGASFHPSEPLVTCTGRRTHRFLSEHCTAKLHLQVHFAFDYRPVVLDVQSSCVQWILAST
jgi:hypothetical protein